MPNTRTVNGKALSENITIPIPTKTSELQNDSNFVSTIPSKSAPFGGEFQHTTLNLNEFFDITTITAQSNLLAREFSVTFRLTQANTTPIVVQMGLHVPSQFYTLTSFILPVGLALNTAYEFSDTSLLGNRTQIPECALGLRKIAGDGVIERVGSTGTVQFLYSK